MKNIMRKIIQMSVCVLAAAALSGCVTNHTVPDIIEREPAYSITISDGQQVVAECISGYLAIYDIARAQPSVYQSEDNYLVIGRTHWGPIYVVRISNTEATGHLSPAAIPKSGPIERLVAAMNNCQSADT